MKAVFASHNPHKAEQVALLLPDIDLIPLDTVAPGLELEEPFDTFEANALAKARAAADATGLPAVADDSGLEVDALGGAPGVLSARYAGEGASDGDNNHKLVRALAGVPEQERTCRYRCVAVLVYPDGRELTASGACEGRVVLEPRGSMGFGYDPHVIPEGETRTMAEIPLDEKLRFSHRGRAFRLLRRLIEAGGSSEDLRALTAEIENLGRTHRDKGPLRSDLDDDPIVQFARWLRDAIDAGVELPNTMTLATASSEGRPSARQVLLKGIDEGGFVFYTNYGSRKGAELEANPHAALVFHWTSIERQVRVTGTAFKVDRDESEAYWSTRDRASRLGAWASRQSSVVEGRKAIEAALEEVAARFEGRDVPLPDFWGGYRVVPDEIEFWEGRPNRLHDRWVYRRTPVGWQIARLAP